MRRKLCVLSEFISEGKTNCSALFCITKISCMFSNHQRPYYRSVIIVVTLLVCAVDAMDDPVGCISVLVVGVDAVDDPVGCIVVRVVGVDATVTAVGLLLSISAGNILIFARCGLE